jgi:hypothetical protein
VVKCSCGTRKDKVYNTHNLFALHCKTKTHQKWIEELNNNKLNYFIEYENSKKLILNQKKIITQLENELKSKNMTIYYLTEALDKEIKNKSHDLIQYDYINHIDE